MKESYPFHIQLHLTDKCNLHCKHCYEGNRKIINEWEYNDVEKLISQLEDTFEKWGVEGEVSLVGGEPIMWPHLSKMLYRLHNSRNIKRFAILTNGVYIPEDVFKAICDTQPTVQISIDGITKEKHDYIRGEGNYFKSMSNIHKLVENNVQVFIHYVISKFTIPITESFIKEMINCGVKQITFSRDVPIGSSDKTFMLTREETKNVMETLNDLKVKYSNKIGINSSRPLWACFGHSGRCPVGIQTLTIMPDGTVYPCRRLPIPIGNVKTQSIYSIWYTSNVLWNLRERKNIKKCGKCEHLDKCGGARCIAYAVTGDYMEGDPQCWM